MKLLYRVMFVVLLCLFSAMPLCGATTAFRKLESPPCSERWFGIYVNNDLVGFYRQTISETADGYRMEGNGSVRMNVMGFSKVASTRESYLVGKNLALRSFEVEQTLNGTLTRLAGRVGSGLMRVRSDSNGKTREKQLKFKGDVYPGPALNLYPLMRDLSAGQSYTILTLDPEEVKIKEVTIRIIGDETTPEGVPALRLRNNLYPFVNNDIWVDAGGNTLKESVREGLVVTRAEDPRTLAPLVSNVALAKKDLIYDFSLVPADPPIGEVRRLTALEVEITGWNDSLPLLQGGGQTVDKAGEGRIRIRTGTLAARNGTATAADSYLKPAEKIESDAPEIAAKAKELAAGRKNRLEIVKALATWTSDWLHDTVEDGGGAIESFKARFGNCQTHARLYTALARAAGIPTRFVSGLVYQEGKGFLYHSWAESLLDGEWKAVDPTYDQVPADPTHLKMFEGHLPEDLVPIVAIIGRIRIKVLAANY
jgi:transglutaminase-like putative cysteine protease